MNAKAFRIGLISDTHGLLRPEALAALQGCDHILHGGDIGDAAILDALAVIAPVTAVRGNNDGDPAFAHLPETARLELGGVVIELIHDAKQFDASRRCDVIVSGHSHRPSIDTVDGVLRINPGSAGPRRFSLPVSVAVLLVEQGKARAEWIRLELAAA